MRPSAWRKKAGYSQDALAREVGISGQNPARTWHRWEIGERQPPISVMARIEELSAGNVTISDWNAVRSEHLKDVAPVEGAAA